MNEFFKTNLKIYNEPPIDPSEVLRYSGMKENISEVSEILLECIEIAGPRLTYKVCYDIFPISVHEGTVSFPFAELVSQTLSRHLADCESAVVFSATIGLEIDRLIAKNTRLSPARAVLLQAFGTERIETLCNLFCNDLKAAFREENKLTLSRFSPGYGDLPLDFQRYIFRVLDCPKKIGVTLNESLLMSPSKSVTAIVGIKSV